MIPEAAAWLILFLPLISFVIIVLFIRPAVGSAAQISGYITVLAIAASFGLSIWALGSVIDTPEHLREYPSHSWLEIGPLNIKVGILMDSLTAIMLIVVSGVSLMIQVYSLAYMKHDPSISRFFAYMSLFTTSMLGLVMADNLVMLYLFWELVGLSSYLLIGFWHERPSAAAAAKKAFIVTRFGDLGFLIAILGVYMTLGSDGLDIATLHSVAGTPALAGMALTLIALGIFAGAVGKSGQFPLHTWLPDAMEGPTPVSALIHAATMVVAGVFLVARFFPLFEASSSAMHTVAYIGAGTALFAATMALVMTDIKRVLAYSTISQLGFMMLALGVGALPAAIFHLFTHAFFKALLFLGAGSVNHATGTYDIRRMGGLARPMPWTFATFLIGGLAISGIPPLAGFWSKDDILSAAWNEEKGVYILGVVAAFLTAFYIFRLIFVTFLGEYRGGESQEQGGAPGHQASPHESPVIMIIPMVVLAAGAFAAGLANLPGFSILGIPDSWMANLLVGHGEVFSTGIATSSSLIAAIGIVSAYGVYVARYVTPEDIRQTFKPIHTLLSRKYYLDDLYEDIIVKKVLYASLANFGDKFDRHVVDRSVNTVAIVGRNIGGAIAKLQTGQVQVYGIGISIGLIVIMAAFWFATS
ncbi:MAG: NADH-quinone oxidoreductase subunit L [Chloroflexi bacterium]|nr:NADH-quinone oxidoreductase subunit L [Chloroflexota bacterium]